MARIKLALSLMILLVVLSACGSNTAWPSYLEDDGDVAALAEIYAQEPAPEPIHNPILYDEIIIRIHDDLQEFAFRAYSRDEEEHSQGQVSYLHVVDTESGAIVSELALRIYDMSETWYANFGADGEIEPSIIARSPSLDSESVRFSNIHFVDINFDGYIDFYVAYWAHWNEMARHFVWDSDSHGFISDPYGLNTLGRAEFDAETRTV